MSEEKKQTAYTKCDDRIPALPASSSETVCKIVEALAKAQGQFEQAKRLRKVVVHYPENVATGRPAESRTYSYAPLDEIIRVTRPALSSNGLVVSQMVKAGVSSQFVRTLLMHSSGEYIASDMPVVVAPNFKSHDLHGAITMSRRVGMQMLLGVAADNDGDEDSPSDHLVEGQQFSGSDEGRESAPFIPPEDFDAPEDPKPAEVKETAKPQGEIDLKPAKEKKVRANDVPAWAELLQPSQLAILRLSAADRGLSDEMMLERYGVIKTDAANSVLSDMNG